MNEMMNPKARSVFFPRPISHFVLAYHIFLLYHLFVHVLYLLHHFFSMQLLRESQQYTS